MIYMSFAAFSLDMRKDTVAGFLPLKQEMIHHCIPEATRLRTLPDLNLIFDSKYCFSEQQ